MRKNKVDEVSLSAWFGLYTTPTGQRILSFPASRGHGILRKQNDAVYRNDQFRPFLQAVVVVVVHVERTQNASLCFLIHSLYCRNILPRRARLLLRLINNIRHCQPNWRSRTRTLRSAGRRRRRRRTVMAHMRLDEMARREGRAEGEFTREDGGADDASELLGVGTGARGMWASYAEEVEHRGLGFEDSASADGADFNAGH